MFRDVQKVSEQGVKCAIKPMSLRRCLTAHLDFQTEEEKYISGFMTHGKIV